MAREAIGHRRRGASYVFFLGTATLVVIIGLSALTVLRVKSRAAEGGHDSVAAQLYAQSAVEQALLTIYTDGGWRGTISPDTWSAPQAIGQGIVNQFRFVILKINRFLVQYLGCRRPNQHQTTEEDNQQGQREFFSHKNHP